MLPEPVAAGRCLVSSDPSLDAAGEQLSGFLIARLDWMTLLVGALTLLFLNVGCGDNSGPERIAVSGLVQLDGAPMSGGLIRFVPKNDRVGPGAMAQIVDGEFAFTVVDGPVPGNHRVEIESTGHLGFEIDDESAFAAQMQKTGRSPLAKNPVPAIYNTASTLTATVTNSDQPELRFDLKSRP